MHQGKQSKASKLITSYGMAPRDSWVAAKVEAMMPRLKQPIDFSPPSVPQQTFPLQSALDQLRKSTGRQDTPLDCYGWSAHWLAVVMHLPSRNPIALQLARLVVLLAQAQLPRVLSFVATMGMLSAINKVSADDQASGV